MINGLCLALVTRLLAAPADGADLATPKLEHDHIILAQPPTEQLARVYPRSARPPLALKIAAPCQRSSASLPLVLGSRETTDTNYGELSVPFLPGLNFSLDSPTGAIAVSQSAVVSRPMPSSLSLAKKYENPDRQRKDIATKPKSSGMTRLGAAALGLGMLVVNQLSGKRTPTQGTAHAKAGVKLKPILWRNTIGLRGEF
jgi:hypothetical protein